LLSLYALHKKVRDPSMNAPHINRRDMYAMFSVLADDWANTNAAPTTPRANAIPATKLL